MSYVRTSKKTFWNKKLLLFPILVFASVLLLCIFVIDKSDKNNYSKYKQYEASIENKRINIIAEAEEYQTEYYNNKISKRRLAAYFDNVSEKLEALYDDFIWTKGDNTTKELFVIKKHIMIIYAQIYKMKSSSLLQGTDPAEAEQLDFITKLQERYDMKDKIQREKYNMPF